MPKPFKYLDEEERAAKCKKWMEDYLAKLKIQQSAAKKKAKKSYAKSKDKKSTETSGETDEGQDRSEDH